MKLKYEDKKEIYRKWKNGKVIKKISEEYLVDEMRIRYLLKYIDKYGIESVKKGKNIKYSKELKEEIINEVLQGKGSLTGISLKYALPSREMLSNWIATYKKNGYTIVEKTRGRPRKMGRKPKKKLEEITRIFQEHKARYGYRRITMVLKNQGIVVNSKKVRRIMKELGLRSLVKRRRKIHIISRGCRKES